MTPPPIVLIHGAARASDRPFRLDQAIAEAAASRRYDLGRGSVVEFDAVSWLPTSSAVG
jgi:hypothetical protein